ncbi:MAG: hypothetical protein HKN78_04125 [Sphingomonadaceae bacterium]|nr:hypothetical protein [Sphingomonadaceae bacterium]
MRLGGGLARLVRQLSDRAGAQPIVEQLRSTPWHSITFSGARHDIVLRFAGDEAADHAAAMADGLDYAEFDLGAHILADIAIARQSTADDGSIIVTLEALILESD